MNTRIIIALTLTASCSGAAWAQGDPMAMARAGIANQVGIMEYCRTQGHVDAAAVAAQRAALAQLPAGAGDTGQAESIGRGGVISLNGTSTSLADFAEKGHTTVPALCKQMASAALQSAAAMSGMTGMPSVGGMPTMPSGMPTMPSGIPPMPSGVPGRR